MTETKREKYIRFLFILFFVFIVFLGFYLRYKDFFISEAEQIGPLALVLKTSNNIENPQIVMYRSQDGQHFLAKYEIELSNNYYFRTIEAVELKKSADQLLLDKMAGFWVQSNDRWYYFSNDLLQEERSEQYLGASTAVDFSMKDGKITMNNDEFPQILNDDNIRELHCLSDDKKLWLVVSDNDMKILTIDTN